MSMRTGDRVRPTGEWNASDFARNGQDGIAKDCGGGGTVITACYRDNGWMLCGHKDGDVCVRVCWDAYPTQSFLYSVEAAQLELDQTIYDSVAPAFARSVSRVAVYCESNPDCTKLASKDAVYLTGQRLTGDVGFVWDHDTPTFYTDSSGLVCDTLASTSAREAPGFEIALNQLHMYARSDMGRSEEGKQEEGILCEFIHKWSIAGIVTVHCCRPHRHPVGPARVSTGGTANRSCQNTLPVFERRVPHEPVALSMVQRCNTPRMHRQAW